MSALADRIAEVMREHEVKRYGSLDWRYGCSGCDWVGGSTGHAAHVVEAVEAAIPVARIREAYEFYLLDSDRSAGEIFAQQVGQILDNQPQEGSDVLVRNKSGFPWYVQLSPTQVEAVSQPQEDT